MFVNKKLDPLNLALIMPDIKIKKLITPVTELAIFENNTRNFHPNGLFSVEIFGRVGTKERNNNFAYIDLNIDIIHPFIYKKIIKMKSLYADIMASKKYAVWDSEVNDFIETSISEGDTGYYFFMKHINKITFESTKSAERESNIELLNKYRGKYTMNLLYVLPAGLRDYVIDDNGKPIEDEINSIYRKILSITNLLNGLNLINSEFDISTIDSIRFKLQIAVLEIFEYILNLIKGKNKFTESKWAKRAIWNGTRAVITSYASKPNNMDDPQTVGFNETVVGLYQYAKAALPITIHHLKTKILDRIFDGERNTISVIDKEDYRTKEIELDLRTRKKWMSIEGIESIITSFSQEGLRDKFIEINNNFLCLIYVDDKSFKLVFNIDDVPDNIDRGKIRPITFAEMLYICLYAPSKEYPATVTRYPVAGLGGIYPCYIYLKVTNKSLPLYERDMDWNIIEDDLYMAKEFPIRGERYHNTLSPHFSNLSRLVADFDGDQCNLIVVYTDEAKQEIKDKLNSRNFYISPNGDLTYSVNDDVISTVLKYITS